MRPLLSSILVTFAAFDHAKTVASSAGAFPFEYRKDLPWGEVHLTNCQEQPKHPSKLNEVE